MHPKEVVLANSFITNGMRMLEWGSGGSTEMFAARTKLTSIEHDITWYEKIQTLLIEKGLIADYRLVTPNKATGTKQEQFSDYINEGLKVVRAGVDIIFIDGRARPECAMAVVDFIGSDVPVMIHDYYQPSRKHYQVVESRYKLVASESTTSQGLAIFKRR